MRGDLLVPAQHASAQQYQVEQLRKASRTAGSDSDVGCRPDRDEEAASRGGFRIDAVRQSEIRTKPAFRFVPSGFR